MEFKLSTVGELYCNMEHINSLSEIGFEFTEHNYNIGEFPLDEEKPRVLYGIKGCPTVEIDTIEQLVEFSNKHGEIIVKGNSIKIYDDYNES